MMSVQPIECTPGPPFGGIAGDHLQCNVYMSQICDTKHSIAFAVAACCAVIQANSLHLYKSSINCSTSGWAPPPSHWKCTWSNLISMVSVALITENIPSTQDIGTAATATE